MALTSGNISSMIQGVSQQPDALRLPSQLEGQENCYSSPVEGLTNRPPLEHIAVISNEPLEEGAMLHTINRSVDQRYKAIISNGYVEVFDLEGNEKTVNSVDESVIILSNAVATGAGQVFIIAPAPGETELDFTVSGLGTATVALQLSEDNAAWTTVATRNTNGTTTGVAIGDNLYMRANVTAYTSGSIIVTITYKNMRYLLVTNSPVEDIRAVTVADTTFLVNRTKTPALLSDLTAERDAEAIVFVKQGNYAGNYYIIIDGVARASHTTSDTLVAEIATDIIAGELYDDLVAWGGAGFSFTRIGSTIWITKSSGTFTIRAEDSNGGTDIYAFAGTTARFSDLPEIAPDGFVIAIQANPDLEDSEGYYVKAECNQAGETFGPSTWVECPAGGISYIMDETTMPHTLTRESDGTFTYEPIPWVDRVVGDDTTNAAPSFIGYPINDTFFYKNRLGFLADDSFVFSEVGEYFNFWRTTVTQLKDSDPIDFSARHTKVAILQSVVPFNKGLILFSDQTQFNIPGDVAMTSKTIRADVVSEFENDFNIRPVNAGKVIYFIFKRGSYAGIKELFVSNSNADNMDANDTSSHVPAYIPSGVFSLSVSTLANIAAVLTTGDPGSIYLYKTEWNNEKKIQSAYFRWNLDDYTDSTVNVLSADFIEDTLYLLVQRDQEVCLEKVRLLPNRVDEYVSYVTLLDRRITDEDCSVVAYDANTNRTTFTLPYTIQSEQMAVITRGIEDNTGMADVGKVLQIDEAEVGTDTISVIGDYEDNPVWIGQRFYCEAELSTIYIRRQSHTGAQIIDSSSNLQLLRGVVRYDTSGAFVVSVTPQGRSVSNHIFNGRITGDINNVLGTVALASGKFKFGILSNNERVTITFNSNSHLKFSISSLDWEGEFTKRSYGG